MNQSDGRNLRYLQKNDVLKIFERVNCPGQFSGSWIIEQARNPSLKLCYEFRIENRPRRLPVQILCSPYPRNAKVIS